MPTYDMAPSGSRLTLRYVTYDFMDLLGNFDV